MDSRLGRADELLQSRREALGGELALAVRQVLATLAELGAQDALLDVGILGHGTHPRLQPDGVRRAGTSGYAV